MISSAVSALRPAASEAHFGREPTKSVGESRKATPASGFLYPTSRSATTGRWSDAVVVAGVPFTTAQPLRRGAKAEGTNT